jgi:hypothetical protein
VCRPDTGASSSDGGATPIGGRCVCLNGLGWGAGAGFGAGGAGLALGVAATGFGGAGLFDGSGGGRVDLARAGSGGGVLLVGSGGGLVGTLGGADLSVVCACVTAGLGGSGRGWSTWVTEMGAGGTTGRVEGAVDPLGTYRGGGGGSAGPAGTAGFFPSKASCAATTNEGGGGMSPFAGAGSGPRESSGTSCAGFHCVQPRVQTGAFDGIAPLASAARSSASLTSRC